MTTEVSPSRGVPLLRRPLSDYFSRQVVKDVCLIVFLFSISGAAWQFVDISAEKLCWIAADATVAIQFLRYPGPFLDLCRRAPFFMIWPLLACLSAAWSPDPGFTFYQGIQLLLTVFASFLICIEIRLEKFIEAIFIAMTGAAIVVLATCVFRPNLGIDSAHSWIGGFTTKNVMGDSMVLLVVSGTCLFLHGRWRVATAISVCLGLFLILMSRAATPLLSLMLTLLPVPLLLAFMKDRRTLMETLGVLLIVGSLLCAAIFVANEYAKVSVIDDILAMVGKERTLTGRTLLWGLADEAIQKNPWFGMGFKGYWVNPPAGMLEVRAAFNQQLFFFHNNYLEVAVAYGVMGPVILILGIASGFFLAFRRLAHHADPLIIWPLLIAIQVLIQTFVQYPLMVNHSMWQVIFIAAAFLRR